MSIKEEFVDSVKDGLPDRFEGMDFRPGIEVWPYDDDFGRWVAGHEDRIKAVMCETPEFRSSPFCGLGMH